jgi:hypothetical protein
MPRRGPGPGQTIAAGGIGGQFVWPRPRHAGEDLLARGQVDDPGGFLLKGGSCDVPEGYDRQHRHQTRAAYSVAQDELAFHVAPLAVFFL